VVNDIPVMVVEDLEPTQPEHWASAEEIEAALGSAPQPAAGGGVDPVVSGAIVRTQGHLYSGAANRLSRYPVPDFPEIPSESGAGDGRIVDGNGRSLLDVGCNWGRWTIAALRAGYRPIGVDPSFEGLLAARRVASQLGLTLRYVCADARRLPFRDASFDVAFSYSVLQHFSRDDMGMALGDIARVLRPGGTSWVQMPNAFGARNLYQQARRGFRRAVGFEVRYWSPSA